LEIAAKWLGLKRKSTQRSTAPPYCITARERIGLITDEDTFHELFNNIQPTDALGFVDSKAYPKRLEAIQAASGYDEAVVTGTARLNNMPIALGIMVFEFIGGSMGSVVGERITKLIEHAEKNRLPLILVTASGGARMQEGILSLMQMAKTSGALARLAAKKIPYISILTNPSTGGVMASFASLGDLIVTEPDSLIGFAGPRVIKETIKQILPKGFQKSEFVQDHGFVDLIIERKDMKTTLALLLSYLAWQQVEHPTEAKSDPSDTKSRPRRKASVSVDATEPAPLIAQGE
jgi:acetyl-CoA carboxylase carboxyl transferase subunit beta